MPVSRRALLAAAALTPVALRATRAEEPLVRRPIPSTGETLPAIGIGTSRRYEVEPSPEAVKPLREAVETFVRSHGLQIDAANPAGWIMCHYKMDGSFGTPEHFWIELPTPSGGRVLLQTVPDIPYIEAGGTNLRWHDPGSVPERQHEHEAYATIEVPVAALKGRHSEIINGILDRLKGQLGRDARKVGE